MSLIIDLLRKVGEKDKTQGVPLSIASGSKSVRNRRGVIIILLFVSVLIGAGAYVGVSVFLQQKLTEERIQSEFIALKERVRASRASAPAVSDEGEEAVSEPDEEPSVMDATEPVPQPVENSGKNPQTGKPAQEQAEEGSKQAEEPEVKELQQAKMSNLSEEKEIEKVVEDILPEKTPPKAESQPATGLTARINEAMYSNNLFYGDLYFKRGNLLKSLKYYEKAYSIRKTPKVANNLVLIYTRLGLFKKAEEIIEDSPDEKLVYTYLMELARVAGTKRTLEKGDDFLEYDRQGYVHFALGYIYDQMGEHEKALRHYSTAYTRNPSNMFFAYNYARMLEATGKLRKAFVVYRGVYTEATDKKLKETAGQRLRLLRSLGVSDEKR